VDRKRGKLQLALMRAFMRGARRQGALDEGFRRRVAAIVEQTAIAIEPDEDDSEWDELLASVRRELAAGGTGD
jgi:hypothetical protein